MAWKDLAADLEDLFGELERRDGETDVAYGTRRADWLKRKAEAAALYRWRQGDVLRAKERERSRRRRAVDDVYAGRTGARPGPRDKKVPAHTRAEAERLFGMRWSVVSVAQRIPSLSVYMAMKIRRDMAQKKAAP